MANEYRVSQVAAEVLHGGEPKARVTHFAVEALYGMTADARISHFAMEVLRSVDSAGHGRRMSLM